MSFAKIRIFSCLMIFTISAQFSLGAEFQITGQSVPAALPDLKPNEQLYFAEGLRRFLEVDSVRGTEPGAIGVGLGPRFNSNSCVSCHANPTAGGSSPIVNPLMQIATRYGAQNKIPNFLKIDGPIKEPRFKYKADGKTRDGGVHNLFVISGRRDAGACQILQQDFEKAERTGNLTFRIPTPLFGAGLIEQITDQAILTNKASQIAEKRALGISGHANTSGNDGTITRFGWKAQNKSLSIFAGEAYNVEQGVTSDAFPTERSEARDCAFNSTPEDKNNLDQISAIEAISDVTGFVSFMRFLAPLPRLDRQTKAARAPAVSGMPEQKSFSETELRSRLARVERGAKSFAQVGCAFCHTPELKTGASDTIAMNQVAVPLYSDLLVHHMGPELADDIIQGAAGPDEFRSAPLWGLGRRTFYLHDGRTNDLEEAIYAHRSEDPTCWPGQMISLITGQACRSEASAVVDRFQELPNANRHELIEFLKSL